MTDASSPFRPFLRFLRGMRTSTPVGVSGAPCDPAALDAERDALLRGARMHRVHWFILGASLVVTLLAWAGYRERMEERSFMRFERERDQVSRLLVERFARHEDALRTSAATFASYGWSSGLGGRMSRAQWRRYVERLDLVGRYPGIGALGVAYAVDGDALGAYADEQRAGLPQFVVHPVRDADEHLVVTYIEPDTLNKAALGLDLLHERERAEAAAAARDSGEPRITGPIALVQDSTAAPSFVFMAPLYRGDAVPRTVAQRRAAFAGTVVAPFRVAELMEGALARDLRHVALRVSDAGSLIHDELLPDDEAFDADPLFTDSVELAFFGRTWRIDVSSDLSFRADAGLATPTVILVGGLGIDVALFVLFVLLTNRNRRALAYADRADRALHEKMGALKASNEELESFAHIVSHDLKTPLRGIGDLVEYINEDLEPYLGSPEAEPDVARNLDRLSVQHRRMSHLIDSVLSYSALGREQISVTTLDVARVVERLAQDLGLDDERLVLRGPRPVFETQAVRFEQVMLNLVDNARKHFPGDPAALRIEIRTRRAPGGWTFEVADNGHGIAPEYHGQVFQVFSQLRSKDEVEGSGVGLSIVKRSVETVGGSVTLRSEEGRGATFTIFWPDGSANGPDEVVAFGPSTPDASLGPALGRAA